MNNNKNTKQKANCLTRALDQWDENRDVFKLRYNGNHVIAIEEHYRITFLSRERLITNMPYLSPKDYGIEYFNSSFALSLKYVNLLYEYLKTEE